MVSVYELGIGSIQRKVTNDCEEKGVFGQEYPLLSKITDYYTCQEILERFRDFKSTSIVNKKIAKYFSWRS